MQSEADAPLVGITAMAGTLPTGAEGMPTADAVRPVSLGRWDVEDAQRASGSAPEARFGAFICDADLFDGAAFHISRCEQGQIAQSSWWHLS